MKLDQKNHFYRGFQDQREETNHYLGETNRDHQQNVSNVIKKNYLHFHINHSIPQLMQIIKKILKKKCFKCVELFSNQLLIIRLQICDRLEKLFICREPPKFLLRITTEQIRSIRLINLHPIKPNLSQKETNKIKNNISKYLLNCTQLKKALTLQQQLLNKQNQYKQDIYSLEATAEYMFSKILIDTKYNLGKEMITLKNKHLHQEQQYLAILSLCLNEISNHMLENFNCSRKELNEILCYCRRSVQYFYYHSNLSQEDQSIQNHHLKNTVPITYAQLQLLNKSILPMDVFKNLFMLGQLFKAQTYLLKIKEDQKKNIITEIRENYGEILQKKSKIVEKFGYVPPLDQEMSMIILQMKK